MKKGFHGLIFGLFTPLIPAVALSFSGLEGRVFTDILGQTFTIEDFKGKVLVVVISDPSTKDQSREISFDLAMRYSETGLYEHISLINLKKVPRLLHWLARKRVLKRQREAVETYRAYLMSRNRPVPEDLEERIRIVPDWDGTLCRLFVGEGTLELPMVVVIDRDSTIVASLPCRGDTDPLTRIISGLLKK